jgi:hypothetical protein
VSFRDSARKLGLALLGTVIAVALGAAAASAQTDTGGSGVPGSPVGTPPTTTTTGTPGMATLLPDGTAIPPANAPNAVKFAIAAANRIHTKTYIWGGGHRSWKAKGYDCSGAVSYVLHAAGIMPAPLVSGQLARIWGAAGTGLWITVYANKTHTFAYIAGLRWDTSPVGETINQGRGPRWRYTIRSTTGYASRYFPGL